MRIDKKLKYEKKRDILKILAAIIFLFFTGYLLYILIKEGFFIGWEIYFAVFCYILISIVLVTVICEILRWIYFDINIKDGKLNIKDGIFIRTLSIPIDRIYYLNSIKLDKNMGYDSILFTDKKISHSKLKPASQELLSDREEHKNVLNEIKERYPGKNFYFYRVRHNKYRFLYYFYLIYKNCENCRFSDESMEIVKKYVQIK